MVQNDTFRGVVSGTIRGARTVRINPTGSDTYEIVLEIDRDMISYLIGTRAVWFEAQQNTRAEVIVILDLYARLERRRWLDLARLPIADSGFRLFHARRRRPCRGHAVHETTGRAVILDPAMEQEARGGARGCALSSRS